MFRPVIMCRIHAMVLARDERVVLVALGTLGLVQLMRADPEVEATICCPRDNGQQFARWEQVLARVSDLRQSLELSPWINSSPPREMSLRQAESLLKEIEGQYSELGRRRQQLSRVTDEVATALDRVANYRGLDVPLDGPDKYSFLHFVTGSLPATNFEQLWRELSGNVVLLPLPPSKGRVPFLAMTSRAERSALEHVLQQAGLQVEALPVVEHATLATWVEANQRKQRETAVAFDELNADLRALAKRFAVPLGEVESAARFELRLLQAGKLLSHTESAVLLSGWVPADRVATCEQRVRQVTGDRCMIETTLPGNTVAETTPTLLRNCRLLRPFAMLVSAYGLPRYDELEPTLFVAISYVLMFGFMFGDVGHGIVLGVCGLLALLIGRSEKVRDMGVLILTTSASSILFGGVYGSCFGLEFFKRHALWRDPLTGDPASFLFVSVGIGIVLVSLGLVLNICNRFRNGDVLGGLLGRFGALGLVFYWGGIVLVAEYGVIASRNLVGWFVALFVVLPLVGWTLKAPVEHWMRHGSACSKEPRVGLPAMLAESIVGAFEAVLSYLANTISFVRLAAYAMSHAALLVAAFMVAEVLRHVSFGGEVFSLLVIVLGNVVAIVLEGIIASVQALRLEYYEFFSKFFSGSGQPFQPFQLAVERSAGARMPL